MTPQSKHITLALAATLAAASPAGAASPRMDHIRSTPGAAVEAEQGPPLVGDVNGDGLDDLIFAGQGWSGPGLNLRTKLSRGNGQWTERAQVLGDGPLVHTHPPLVGDFDGNGRADVAFVGQGWSGPGLNIRAKLSNGDGTFRAVGQVLGDGPSVHALPTLVGDLDGDGRDDLVFVGQGWSGPGLNIRVKFSNGDGTFRSAGQVLGDGPGVHSQPTQVADVNGDGRDDLVFVGQGWSGPGLNIRVKLSNGDGTFTQRAQVPGDGPAVHAWPPMVGDFDGDGRDDIVMVGEGWSGPGLNVRVKLSRGDGTWSAPRFVPGLNAIFLASRHLAADVDGDGRTDLLFVRGVDGGALRVETLLSRGDGTFSHHPVVPPSIGRPAGGSAVAADVDGDGQADVVLVGASGALLDVRALLVDDPTVPVTYLSALTRLQTAYRSRDGERYARLMRHENRMLRRMTPDRCIEAEAAVIRHGCEARFDGLEALLLGLHDCAAADPTLAAPARANMERLRSCLAYHDAPAAALPEAVATWNSSLSRSTRGEALRVLLDALAGRGEAAAGADLSTLLAADDVRTALCGLPGRPDQHGRVALEDLLRLGACRLDGVPGGFGSTDAICAQAGPATDPALGARPGAPARGDDALTRGTPEGGMRALTDEELDRLGDFCRQRGTGANGLGIDALDGYASDTCADEAMTDESVQPSRLAEAFQECLGGLSTAGGNSVANGASGQAVEPSADETSDNKQQPTPDECGGIACNSVDYVQDGAGVVIDRDGTNIDVFYDENGNGSPLDEAREFYDRLRQGGNISDGLDPLPGADLSNPACQELAGMGLLNGRRSDFWDGVFDRQPGRDPRRENPHPDDPSYGGEADGEDCHGTDPYASAACNTLVLCSDGLALDPGTCSCAPRGGFGAFGPTCLDTQCPPGVTAVPVGAFSCACLEQGVAPADGGGIPPRPGPGPMDRIFDFDRPW